MLNQNEAVTVSRVERKIRAGLPLIRWMQAALPLPAGQRLLKLGMKRVQLGADCIRETVSAGGVACDWIIPRRQTCDAVLLYLHGGGFVFGQTPLHLQMGATLAQKLGMRVLMVDYRLAPQHPFPAALEDCLTAYDWLLSQGVPAQRVVTAGDSAGGNLVLTMLLKLRSRGGALPAAAACLSPVTDLTTKKDLRRAFKDPLLPPRAMELYTRSYVGSHDAHDPLISPVYGDLRGLPPLLVHVGEDEILREDAVRITDRAKSAGVEVRLEIYPRMWHVWQLNLALPQAVQSLGDIALFFNSHLQPAAR